MVEWVVAKVGAQAAQYAAGGVAAVGIARVLKRFLMIKLKQSLAY